jgi:hypothetical protein
MSKSKMNFYIFHTKKTLIQVTKWALRQNVA